MKSSKTLTKLPNQAVNKIRVANNYLDKNFSSKSNLKVYTGIIFASSTSLQKRVNENNDESPYIVRNRFYWNLSTIRSVIASSLESVLLSISCNVSLSIWLLLQFFMCDIYFCSLCIYFRCPHSQEATTWTKRRQTYIVIPNHILRLVIIFLFIKNCFNCSRWLQWSVWSVICRSWWNCAEM